jgi:hypothetical protein
MQKFNVLPVLKKPIKDQDISYAGKIDWSVFTVLQVKTAKWGMERIHQTSTAA